MRLEARGLSKPARLGPAELVLLAFSGAGVLALVFLGVVWVPAMARMFADFGSAGSLPSLTRLILSRPWLVGCIVAVLAAGAAGAFLPGRRARIVTLIVALTVAVVAVGATVLGGYMPIWQLASAVRAE